MRIKNGETYGQFLIRLRQTAHLTQRELGLRLGFSNHSICSWEKGISEPIKPSKREIDRLAEKIN